MIDLSYKQKCLRQTDIVALVGMSEICCFLLLAGLLEVLSIEE